MSAACVLLCLVRSFGQDNPKANTARIPAAIEDLHKKDIAASKAGDIALLASLWTDDGIALLPNHEPVIGINAIRQWLNASRLDTTKVEIVEYTLDFQEVQVVEDTAFEWAQSQVTVRPNGSTAEVHNSRKLMRVLKRESDGTWKVARAIWNVDGQPSEKGR